jgi:hypothetical protein
LGRNETKKNSGASIAPGKRLGFGSSSEFGAPNTLRIMALREEL